MFSKWPVPEFIEIVFAKTSTKRWFSMTENERFGLVFAKTGSINSGTGIKSSDVYGDIIGLSCLCIDYYNAL
jgi:hypothetical protein